MRGDFSRLPAGSGSAYARVLMQQGRLQTDADLNAQAHLAAEAQAAALRDLMGPAGGPADAGFGLRGHGGFRFDAPVHGAAIEHSRDTWITGGFTLEGWVKRADRGSGVLVEHAGSTGRCRGFSLEIDDGGRLRLRLHGGERVDAIVEDAQGDVAEFAEAIPAVELASDAPLPVGRFVHVAAVASEAHVRLYLDGVLRAERRRAAAVPFTAAPMRIGRGFRGVLDGWRLWRAAAGPELLLLRADGVAMSELVAFDPEWRLFDMVGARDAHGRDAGADGEAPHPAEPELRLGAGRYYLDGLPSRLAHDCAFERQPEGPGLTPPPAALRDRRPGPYLAWLEAVDVVVTAHEDDALHEPAFGDADTAARLRTISRVRLALGDEGEATARAHPGSGALTFERTPDTQLGEASLARVEIHDAGFAALPTDARRPADEGFRVHELSPSGWATLDDEAFGHEALWRPGRPLELVRVGDGHALPAHVRAIERDADARTRLRLYWDGALDPDVHGHGWRLRPIATFKWSYDNAAYAARVTAFEGDDVLHLDDVAERSGPFGRDDVVEIGDLELTLHRRPAALAGVRSCDLTEAEDALRLVLDRPDPDPLGGDGPARLARRPVLRRWDRFEGAGHGALARVSTSGPIRLGQGLQVTFAAGHHQTGEAWTCPVRDTLDWPLREGVPAPQPAMHGRTRKAAVARLVFGRSELEVRDLRRLFAPLARRRIWDAPQIRDPDIAPVEALEIVETRATRTAAREVEAAVETVEAVQVRETVDILERPIAQPAPSPDARVLTRRMDGGTGLRYTGASLSSRRRDPHWTRLPFRPPFEGALAAATLEGRPAVLGRGGELALLDTAERTWELRAPMPPTGFDARTVAVLHGRLHVLGFDEASERVLHQRYDPGEDAWRDLAPLPEDRRRFSVCAVGGLLYAAGGFLGRSRTPCDAFNAFDPETDGWSKRPRLPYPVARAAVAACEGRVHLLGGVGSRPPPLGPAPLRRTAVFSPSHARWTDGPALPDPRFDSVAVATQSRIHLLGGEGEGERRVHAEMLDPAALAWLEQPQPSLTGRLAATVSDGSIYILSTGAEAAGAPLELCEVDDVLYVHALV